MFKALAVVSDNLYVFADTLSPERIDNKCSCNICKKSNLLQQCISYDDGSQLPFLDPSLSFLSRTKCRLSTAPWPSRPWHCRMRGCTSVWRRTGTAGYSPTPSSGLSVRGLLSFFSPVWLFLTHRQCQGYNYGWRIEFFSQHQVRCSAKNWVYDLSLFLSSLSGELCE